MMEKRLQELLCKHRDCKLMVHNGFFAWSYGTPQDPLLISFDTAVKILLEYEERTGKDAISELENTVLGLVYADQNDDLYLKTNNNRIIGLYDFGGCIFTLEYDKDIIHDFDL